MKKFTESQKPLRIAYALTSHRQSTQVAAKQHCSGAMSPPNLTTRPSLVVDLAGNGLWHVRQLRRNEAVLVPRAKL